MHWSHVILPLTHWYDIQTMTGIFSSSSWYLEYCTPTLSFCSVSTLSAVTWHSWARSCTRSCLADRRAPSSSAFSCTIPCMALWTLCNKEQQGSSLFNLYTINSLRPSDAIWWYRCGSTLAQVMVWCLAAPNHYLSQHWPITLFVLKPIPN